VRSASGMATTASTVPRRPIIKELLMVVGAFRVVSWTFFLNFWGCHIFDVQFVLFIHLAGMRRRR